MHPATYKASGVLADWIGADVGYRIGDHGRIWHPAWRQQSLYVDDDGRGAEDTCCAYCGDRYTDVEHVVPWSWFSKVIGLVPDEELWTWLLPACEECNRLASDQIFGTPARKRKHIHERLRARYSYGFLGEQWEPQELDELGPNLRQFVEASQAKAENVRERVGYRGPLPSSLGSGAVVRALRHLRAAETGI